MILLKIAWRELKRSWRFTIFFIFNFSLGLAGFLSIESFNRGLQREIRENSKSILSADLAVSARREFTDTELQKIREVLPQGVREGKTYEFFAMIRGRSEPRLVLVKAIDDTYPFYGSLERRSQVAESGSVLIGQRGVWIYPELEQQMGLGIGDELQLGELNLRVADVIAKDQTQTFRAASMAPKVFIDRALLPESKLIQFGSTITVSYLYKLPPNTDEQLLKEKLLAGLPDPQISIDTPQSAGESAGRQLAYLSDYLGLVALIAFFMSALGASYLYRLFLGSRLKEVAILRTLGLQSEQAVGVYILQATLLGLMATIPAIGFSELILPFLTKLLATFSPFSIQSSLDIETLIISVLLGTLGSFFVSLPLMVGIFDLKAAKLFSEEGFSQSLGGLRRPWAYVPALMFFCALSVYQANSWRIGLLFVAALMAMVLLLWLLGYLMVRSAFVLRVFSRWEMKYSFLSLSRRANSTMAVFIALGLGALLINILPQLKKSLQADFQVDGKARLPSLFLFDIQEEQVDKVKEVLRSKEIDALNFSPLVRARILSVNGKDYERMVESGAFKTREEEAEARFRNRGVNLSYRDQLGGSEEIVEGRPLGANFDSQNQTHAELSIEKRFAERMGFHLKDIIAFDVQGVPVTGQVVNFRRVKWTSFQPNFFILFQNGVINEAPKTYVAAIPAVTSTVRGELQAELSREVSNVSIIDVVRLVDEVLKTAEKMSWSLELMAYLALFTGYVVLYSIVRHQVRQRRWELNMLKVLGADVPSVAIFILNEFGFLSFLSSLLGAGLSVGVSYFLNNLLFQTGFEPSLTQPLMSVVSVTGLSLLISFMAGLQVFRENALKVIRDGK